MKKRIVALCLIAVLLSACTGKEETAAPFADNENTWELISQAYIYVFPLVLTDATKTLSTNTVQAASGRAPINQFNHARKLADASFHTVVTPNVDTIYSQAWLDVGEEPMIYIVPETDRFFNVQILDAWTNTAAVLEQSGAYAITLPGWEGELPDGVTRVDVPTETAWTIARILLSGEDDLPNVYAIQEQMALIPLSSYVSDEDYTPPQGSYTEADEFVPVEKVFAMSPKAFFDAANELMSANPPAEEDAELLEKLATIHVGPGISFDASILGEDAAERWIQMLTGLRTTLASDGVHYAQKLGQWTYYGSPIGDFGTAYTYRAMVALVGLGANTVDVAIYPKTIVDETGAVLTGEKTYVLHFDSLPCTQESGFWSVTAYGSDDFLIDNPIDRYCINDRSAFVLNEDGSLDIALSKEQPENTDNWLPVSEGEFHLFLRIYLPDMEALATWQPPVIRVN